MQVLTYIRMSPTAFSELLLLKNNHEDKASDQYTACLPKAVFNLSWLPNLSLIKCSLLLAWPSGRESSSLEICTLQAQKTRTESFFRLVTSESTTCNKNSRKQSNRDVHRRNVSESSSKQGQNVPQIYKLMLLPASPTLTAWHSPVKRARWKSCSLPQVCNSSVQPSNGQTRSRALQLNWL